MKTILDIKKGQRFSSLVIINEVDRYISPGGQKKRRFKCVCDCGKTKIFFLENLTQKKTGSCGCKANVRQRENIIGAKFGKLIVIKDLEDHVNKNGSKVRVVRCVCECGNFHKTRLTNLKKGSVKSCGCIKNQSRYIHGLSRTKFHRAWQAMRRRCDNKKLKCYNIYGGRGIKVCEEWNSFSNFKEDMYKIFLEHINDFGENNTTLDRIDVNGNYCKENCRWATNIEQSNNKRNTKYFSYRGEKMSLPELCRKLNLNYRKIYKRMRLGWDIVDALEK